MVKFFDNHNTEYNSKRKEEMIIELNNFDFNDYN